MTFDTRRLQFFLFGQDLADGLRVTLLVLIPGLICAYLNQLEAGFILSLGALSVSVTDIPGPTLHKRNGMLACVLCMLLVALVTGFARLNVYVLGAEILLFSFCFTMLMVYGIRAGAVGTAALLVMIIMMDQPLTPRQVLQYAALVSVGGLWYTAASLLTRQVRPYRPVERALGECMHAIAKFLELKADFYEPEKDLNTAYRVLLAQQVVVSERQDAMRQLLFKSRQLVEDSTGIGRALMFAFIEAIDLYEHITATYYDYAALRQRFGATGLLPDMARLIRKMAAELDEIGLAIHSNRAYHTRPDWTAELDQLKARIDALAEQESGLSVLMLKKVLVNFRNMQQQLQALVQYFDPTSPTRRRDVGPVEYRRFVARENLSPDLLLNNLTVKSSVFRHAVRMGLACLFGFGVAKLVSFGHHSYWIVMTCAFMLKPGFSLTKERNYQRVLGTIGGGLLGVVLLWLITDTTLRFVLMVLLMIGTYSFQRRNYVVSVFLMTPFLLIMFTFLGLGFLQLLGERVIDTLLGCAIALAAGYLLFPTWEANQLRHFMREVVEANLRYLQQLADRLAGRPLQLTEYKLVRKAVYISSANLSAAFQRMLSEPESKRQHSEEVQQFVVLNHILSSNIATLGATLTTQPGATVPPEQQRPLGQAMAALSTSLRRLDPATPAAPATPESAPAQAPAAPATRTPDDQILTEQLAFIRQLSQDISKVTEAALA
ncbi:membrane protein [Hymenobacter sp. DG25B]|jgi:uncharacterized membrane protein (TIGR01666 family)|uniref:FUSC family membrane protein n=1 Tax=Hymenobacter sp. DG25B TaxID=1385664 RepID=UPI000540B301|nr:FUSC family membrane protein [Hymenobacter sp. DG25B]AIZ64435.1 membrane protein [Hymenobacter sp. DG25B]